MLGNSGATTMRLSPLAAGCLTAAALCFGVSAEDKKPSERLPPGWNGIEITDAQKAEVLKIDGEYREKIEPLEQQIYKLKAEQVKKRMAVLTDEQRKKLRDQAGEPTPDKKPGEKGKDGR
jgi:hypothetical protein